MKKMQVIDIVRPSVECTEYLVRNESEIPVDATVIDQKDIPKLIT
jgi:hypothetical protein